MTGGTRVSEGLLLVIRQELGEKVRFDWWCVKSVRQPKKNGDVTATLVSGTESISATATATFPGGIVADPWRVVKLPQRDWQLVWEGRAAA
jgi:hypothetical protein